MWSAWLRAVYEGAGKYRPGSGRRFSNSGFRDFYNAEFLLKLCAYIGLQSIRISLNAELLSQSEFFEHDWSLKFVWDCKIATVPTYYCSFQNANFLSTLGVGNVFGFRIPNTAQLSSRGQQIDLCIWLRIRFAIDCCQKCAADQRNNRK